MLIKDDVNKMEIKFKGIVENIKFIRNSVAMFLYPLDLTESLINEIKIVVSEGVTNSIVHGYNNIPNEIEVILEYNDSEITFEIRDFGVGIEDINKAKEPLYTSKPSEERSGLGFTIMEMFLDKLEIISKVNEGTTLRCHKIFNV